jgi:branched-chain amino acid transport system ATP-binding protein
VSFAVPDGQRIAIIGPNGAGKSTLLNVIDGHVTPVQGRILVNGSEITGRRVDERAHLGVSRSFQVSSVFPEFPVFVNVWLALAGTEPWRWQVVRRADEYEDALRSAEQLLREWGLWHQRDAAAQTISYGEQRKLETVMALASKPKLLLLDEPSAGLTIEESSAIVNHLRGLTRETTVVLVAHDMDLVFGVAERIVVLNHGEVLADGTTDEIRNSPVVANVYMGRA